MKTNKLLIFLTLFPALLLLSCEKGPGEGGTSTIFGKVVVKKYNSTFTVLMEEYAAQDQEVYVIFGEDRTFSQRLRTNFDGTYESKYLRKGTYKIYAYSKDSTLSTNALVPVFQTVEITKNKQEIEVPQITILKTN